MFELLTKPIVLWNMFDYILATLTAIVVLIVIVVIGAIIEAIKDTGKGGEK